MARVPNWLSNGSVISISGLLIWDNRHLQIPSYNTFIMGLKHTHVESTGQELIHDISMILPATIAFEPEARLHWYLTVTNWIVYFHGLPQVYFHWDKIFSALTWLTAYVPIRWIWTSKSEDLCWDPFRVFVDTDLASQKGI